jgi:hypothetical protein
MIQKKIDPTVLLEHNTIHGTVFLKIRIWVKLFKGNAQFLGKYGRKFTDKPF